VRVANPDPEVRSSRKVRNAVFCTLHVDLTSGLGFATAG
jgi:hypothetical protein